MARKHAKKFSKKQPVERAVISHGERKIVTQPDGTFAVIPASPVFQQGKAQGPTTTKGQRNGGSK
jgi:hypothetical protein